MAAKIAGKVNEIEMAFEGYNVNLSSESTMIDRVEVVIKSAGEIRRVFQSAGVGGESDNGSKKSKTDNSEMATPGKPSD